MNRPVKPPKAKQHVMALRLKSRDQLMLDELSKVYNAPKATIMRMALKAMYTATIQGQKIEVETDGEENG